MSEKKELNLEQLKTVSGGVAEKTISSREKVLKSQYFKELGKYQTEAYKNENLYFTVQYTSRMGNSLHVYHSYIFGTLINSWEKGITGGTIRTAKVNVIESEGRDAKSGVVEISLDEWVAHADH